MCVCVRLCVVVVFVSFFLASFACLLVSFACFALAHGKLTRLSAFDRVVSLGGGDMGAFALTDVLFFWLAEQSAQLCAYRAFGSALQSS